MYRFLLFAFLALAMTGCAGIGTAIKHNDLQVNYSNKATIFLEDNAPGDGVSVQIADSTAYKMAPEVRAKIEQTLLSRGYRITAPKDAKFVLKLKIQSEREDTAASDLDGTSGGSSVSAGTVGGAILGSMNRNPLGGSLIGAGIGALVGGASSLVVDNMVKVGDMRFQVDTMILERSDKPLTIASSTHLQQGMGTEQQVSYQEQTNFKRYRGQFLVDSQKVNLDWEDCRAEVTDRIASGACEPF